VPGKNTLTGYFQRGRSDTTTLHNCTFLMSNKQKWLLNSNNDTENMQEQSLSAILYSTKGTRIFWKYDVLQVLPLSNPGGGRDFTAPVQTGPRVHPASCTKGTGSVSWGKAAARGVNYPPTFGAEVKERVELCLYSISGPSWAVLSWTFNFHYYRAKELWISLFNEQFVSKLPLVFLLL